MLSIAKLFFVQNNYPPWRIRCWLVAEKTGIFRRELLLIYRHIGSRYTENSRQHSTLRQRESSALIYHGSQRPKLVEISSRGGREIPYNMHAKSVRLNELPRGELASQWDQIPTISQKRSIASGVPGVRIFLLFDDSAWPSDPRRRSLITEIRRNCSIVNALGSFPVNAPCWIKITDNQR